MTNWINDLASMRKDEIQEQEGSSDAKLIASAILDGFAILSYCVSSGEKGDEMSVTENLEFICLRLCEIEKAIRDSRLQ